MTIAKCQALFLAAPASGQGKTTITAALARQLRRLGKKVRVFKTGPDYLDPQILSQASGSPVYQLDMWMAGEEWCQHQLYLAACEVDIILIEGVMGMFDGTPSSADLAAQFGIPIAIVMDVKGMAQTAAAVAVGLANYRDDVTVAGLIANKCGSNYHQQLIAEALPDSLPMITAVKREEAMELPERHLGLVQAEEMRDELEQRLEAGADNLDAELIEQFFAKLAPVEIASASTEFLADKPDAWLAGKTIAVARDQAFSFIYAANIQLLEDMGAAVNYFSPLNNEDMPPADALWLPGGYPELHADKLTMCSNTAKQIQAFHRAGKPILAECGGFLYCLDQLEQLDGSSQKMLGLLAGKGVMATRGGCQGMQTAPLAQGHVRAHAHHRSKAFDTPEPVAHGIRQRHHAPGEPLYVEGSLTASYLHLFFPANPKAITDLFLGKA